MSIGHIFREYDIRGVFEEDLHEKSIKAIGYLLGLKIKAIGQNVAIGYDARLHSVQISKWLMSGLNKAGLLISNMKLVPTPCNYFAGFEPNSTICATIMITGSHNPSQYNGLKITLNKLPFFGKDIELLGKEVMEKMDTLSIEDNFTCKEVATLDRYVDFLTSHFVHLKAFDKKIIVDCGNGAAGEAVVRVCKNLELDVDFLYENPDGNFPNHHPDPSDEKNLKDIKERLKLDNYTLGFAYDGDGDRLGVLSKTYNFKGDELALLFTKIMQNPKVLGEVKCSQTMYDEINKRGRAYMYKTGHSNIKMKMQELDIDLAVEVSGHIFFNDRYFGYDDAIYAMFRVLELVQKGIDLDGEIAKLPKTYSTDELKIQTTDNEKFLVVEKLKTYLKNPPANFPPIKELVDVDGVRVIFEDGWGLIRASNTTPLLVARFEATSKEKMQTYQKNLYEAVSACK